MKPKKLFEVLSMLVDLAKLVFELYVMFNS